MYVWRIRRYWYINNELSIDMIEIDAYCYTTSVVEAVKGENENEDNCCRKCSDNDMTQELILWRDIIKVGPGLEVFVQQNQNWSGYHNYQRDGVQMLLMLQMPIL